MPFMLYRVSDAAGAKRYDFERTAQLAGVRGPLRAIQSQLNSSGVCPLGWHVSGDDLVTRVAATHSTHDILIDLKPSQKGNVSLYRILDVWGYSYEDWTPLGLRLQVVFGDHEVDDAVSFKKSFVAPNGGGEIVHEFLYVNGGVKRGPWTWGMVGRVNGTLLWKDAFQFLVGEMTRQPSESTERPLLRDA